MSESWGGARTPSNPAAVSGPGALSARTDGGVMNSAEPEYGERQALENLSSGAPLAGGGGGAVSGPTAGQNPLASLVGLGAPSQMSDVPVTAGAAAGDGPGLSALGIPQSPGEETRADVRALGEAQIQALIAAAGRDDATPSFRRLVRRVLYT